MTESQKINESRKKAMRKKLDSIEENYACILCEGLNYKYNSELKDIKILKLKKEIKELKEEIKRLKKQEQEEKNKLK